MCPLRSLFTAIYWMSSIKLMMVKTKLSIYVLLVVTEIVRGSPMDKTVLRKSGRIFLVYTSLYLRFKIYDNFSLSEYLYMRGLNSHYNISF